MTANLNASAARRFRRLFVAWQDPQTRSIEPVATLVQDSGAPIVKYLFSYLRGINALSRFEPFTAFPDADRLYESETLFPFFANRVMARKRSDYGRMMAMLDLKLEAEPFEILARSGARRATDNLEVFPEPELEPRTGEGSCLFFLRGVQYVPGAENAINDLIKGERLNPLLDVQNEVNHKAILIRDARLQLLGYVPDYLASHMSGMLSSCPAGTVRIVVEHVNDMGDPLHMRLLCRLTTCWPVGYIPFADENFQPLAAKFPRSEIGRDLRTWELSALKSPFYIQR